VRVSFRSSVFRAVLGVALSVVIATGVAGLPTSDPVPATPTTSSTTPATSTPDATSEVVPPLPVPDPAAPTEEVPT
jgi:hypothetical protein